MLWRFSWGLVVCSFLNELIYLIILVQVRGEKRSVSDILTWSLSFLQGHRAEKPVPDLTVASSPKSTADTSVSGCWLTLSQTYKEPHWRARVLGFCYLKNRGNLLPSSSFVRGDGSTRFTQRCPLGRLASLILFKQHTGWFLFCCLCFQGAK